MYGELLEFKGTNSIIDGNSLHFYINLVLFKLFFEIFVNSL